MQQAWMGSASIDKRRITIKSDDRAGQQPVSYCVEYVFYLRGKKRSVTRQHLVDEKYCDGKKGQGSTAQYRMSSDWLI